MIGMKKVDVIKIIEEYAEQESDDQKKNDLLDCVQFLKSEDEVSDNIEKFLRSCEIENNIRNLIEQMKFYISNDLEVLGNNFYELISLKKEKSQR